MDWKAYGKSIGLPTDGAMGDYYRPQIEEAMAREQSRQSQLGSQPGFQSGYDLQGGNNMGNLVGMTNQAAGRVNQADQPQQQNPYMPPTMQTQQVGPPSFTTGGQSAPPQQQPASSPMMQPQANSPAIGTTPWSQNPYMQPMFNSILSQNTQNLQRNVLPNLGRAGSAAGGYGDSRQAIAEGIAMGDMAKASTDAMANIGFQGYQFDKNYGLANDALNLNVYNANQNWMNQGQQNQLNALDKLLGWNQTYGVGNAANTQNTPMNYWQQFSNTASQLGGMGGTNSQNMQGNPWLGALGGYLTGSQLFGGKP